MGKIILILLVLLGAALYFPQTRPVVVEFLGPVINPVLTWQTKGEMNRLGRELQTQNREGGNLPAPGVEFQNWMNRNFLGGAMEDAWGVEYSLRVWRDSVNIVSNGPDMEVGTADDITHPVAIQRQRSRR